MGESTHKLSFAVGQRVKINASGDGAIFNGSIGVITKIESPDVIVVQVSPCTTARFRPSALTVVEDDPLTFDSDKGCPQGAKQPYKPSIAEFLGKLAIVLVILGAFIAFMPDDSIKKAALRNVDAGVVLGETASRAVGHYFLMYGGYPRTLRDIPEKIEPTPMADVALVPHKGVVVITLLNRNMSSITGKKMYFKPEIFQGKVMGVSCRIEDGEFRELVKDRCR